MTDLENMDPRKILEQSILIASKEEIMASVDRMAEEINDYYGDREIVLLAVMTGAILPATWIASRLRMPLRMDFVHATRYSGQTEGGQLEFRVPPRLNLEDQEVLVVDDIYDVGLTLELIERYCIARGARTVNSAVLVRKVHDRDTAGEAPRFIGRDVEDKYVFGCGMDVFEHWRHLSELRALENV
jgi:hypoxanthine phosphoribosyltransferase